MEDRAALIVFLKKADLSLHLYPQEVMIYKGFCALAHPYDWEVMGSEYYRI